jgi:pilus assembly protein Flp/PilA
MLFYDRKSGGLPKPLETDTMKNLVTRFAKDESGATAIEYGLIAALIAVSVIGGSRLIGRTINNKFTDIAGQVSGS